MSDANARLARRWFEEVWNQNKPETVTELLHPNVVGQMEGRVVRSPEEFLQAREELLTALPDLRVEVQAVISEGDEVAVRWAANATGPSGAVSFRGVSWVVFENGRIVKGWDAWNQGLLMQQLGVSVDAPSDLPRLGRAKSANRD